MQQTKLKIKFAFISLSLVLFGSGNEAYAQSTSVDAALPAIISFLLESNSAPVNTKPEGILELDIAGMGAFPNIEIPVTVDDADGNLSNINVTSSENSIVGVDDSSVTLDDGSSFNDFTISGSQEALMDSISTLVFSPLLGVGDYTITLTSTDSEGAFDEDTISISVIDSSL